MFPNNRFLVVDPDPSIRLLLVALVRRNGVDVEEAGDHDTAVRLVRSKRFTAFIIDPRMPNGDALLVAMQATTNGGPPNIIITTTPDLLSAALAYRDGVRALLLKPFQIEDLYAAVAECCDGATV